MAIKRAYRILLATNLLMGFILRRCDPTFSGVLSHIPGGWQIGKLFRIQGGAPIGLVQFVLKSGKNLKDILLHDEDRDILHYSKNCNYYLRINNGNASAATAQLNAKYPFELASSIKALSCDIRTIRAVSHG
ncbi:MAG: hypothetical protein HXY20_13460 [Acidobacteria bacterium]|nr:hypothetical protein [Acidobacteriota bacterium]